MKSLITLVLVFSILTGCGSEHTGRLHGKLAVAVSIAPHHWLVKEIGGEHIDVVMLVEAGQSPATYQPSDAQISRVMQSGVYFRSGVPFEYGKWYRRIATRGKMRVVDLREGLTLRKMEAHTHHGEMDHGSHDHGHHHGHDHAHDHAHDPYEGKDPHIWTSPRLLITQADLILKHLVELDVANAPAYQANHKTLVEKLKATDQAIAKRLAPFKGKAFFVYHPAWGYFADAYGLKQMAVEQEGKKPTDAELTALQTQARSAGAKVIFVQPQFAGPSAQAVAAAIDGRVEKLDPLATDVLKNLMDVAASLEKAYAQP